MSVDPEEEFLERPPGDTPIITAIIAAVAFVLIAGVGALAIHTAVEAKVATQDIQKSRVETCRRLNSRLAKLDAAIHTVFPDTDPQTLAGIAVFDEALAAEECQKVVLLHP